MTALERIAENKRTQAKFLDLGNCGLTELPEELFDCVWLENLNLGTSYFDEEKQQWFFKEEDEGVQNQINTLLGIEKLKNLQILYFSQNHVFDLSPLKKLLHLKVLNFVSNNVVSLDVLKNFKNLEKLDFSANEIHEFPYFLKNLPNLKEIVFLPNPYQINKLEFLKPLFENILDEFEDNVAIFRTIADAVEKQTNDQNDYLTLKVKKGFERVFNQYLLLFKEYVSTVKGKIIEFYLRQQGEELLLISNGNTNISQDQILIYLEEYVSLLSKDLKKEPLLVENRDLHTKNLELEIDLFLVRHHAHVGLMQAEMRVLEVQNKYLQKQIDFYQIQSERDHRHILYLQEQMQLSIGKAKENINYDQILADLIDKLIRMAERKTTKKIENLHNDDLTHYLRDMKYYVSDQTRSGRGELDIMIRDIKGTPISIIEAMRLSSCGKENKTVGEHLHRLLYDYDPIGLERNFLIVYAEAQDFEALWENYKNYIDEIMLNPLFKEGYYPQIGGLKEQKSKATDLKIGLSRYERGGDLIEIYHLFVNMV